jgi:ectoine hydroxylase-related dioxygenase (phytanoyl-CoA dioxygenase family)
MSGISYLNNFQVGNIVIRDFLPDMLIKQFKFWAMNNKNIHRGTGIDGIYYSMHDNKREYEMWWTTQPPAEMWLPIAIELTDQIDRLFGNDKWEIHAVDCITTRPNKSDLYAHIDTPYRFEEFSNSTDTLGVQIIIPLDHFTIENGATAYIPGSHMDNIDLKDLEENREYYNNKLLTEGQQFLAKPGDVLMYDGRTLHSTMPNNSNDFRSALLINALNKDIIARVKELDTDTNHIKT